MIHYILVLKIRKQKEWNEHEHIFKLLEQKRDEVEILHDVIEDLQIKVEEMIN